MMKKRDVEWSRQHFAMMREGGVWTVPRSGLIFQKRDGRLLLMNKMPWIDEMPITAKQLEEQQEADFQIIKRHFGAAGIPVEK